MSSSATATAAAAAAIVAAAGAAAAGSREIEVCLDELKEVSPLGSAVFAATASTAAATIRKRDDELERDVCS